MTKNKKLTNQWKEGRCVPIRFPSVFYSMLVPAHRVQRLEWSPVFLFRSVLFCPSGQGMTHRLYPICTTNQVEDRNWGSVRPDRAEVEPDTGIPVARTSYIRSPSPLTLKVGGAALLFCTVNSPWESLPLVRSTISRRTTATALQSHSQCLKAESHEKCPRGEPGIPTSSKWPWVYSHKQKS